MKNVIMCDPAALMGATAPGGCAPVFHKALIAQFNTARDGTMVVTSEYLQVIITKR
jgi:hypothetical protein